MLTCHLKPFYIVQVVEQKFVRSAMPFFEHDEGFLIQHRNQSRSHGTDDIRTIYEDDIPRIDMPARKVFHYHGKFSHLGQYPQINFGMDPGTDHTAGAAEVIGGVVLQFYCTGEFRVSDDFHAANRAAVYWTDAHPSFVIQRFKTGPRSLAVKGKEQGKRCKNQEEAHGYGDNYFEILDLNSKNAGTAFFFLNGI